MYDPSQHSSLFRPLSLDNAPRVLLLNMVCPDILMGITAITVVDLLLDGGNRLLVEGVVLEHCSWFVSKGKLFSVNDMGVYLTESKLLQSAAACLGVQEIDDDELKGNPAAVDGEVLPRDGAEGDGVDVGGEEPGKLAKDLLDTDTAAAM